MIRIVRLTGAALALAVLLSQVVPALAGFERQHGAHVHGQASGSLAQDGERFSLVLHIPGINLAGFEHAPRGQAQRETLQRVIAHLDDGQWLDFDPDGRCRVEHVTVNAPGFAAGERQDHDHRHDRPGQDHDHAEFQVAVLLECSQPAALSWLEADLFTDYPGNEQMHIDVLTDRRVDRVRLRPGNPRIRLGTGR